jgi:hypothetical protein
MRPLLEASAQLWAMANAPRIEPVMESPLDDMKRSSALCSGGKSPSKPALASWALICLNFGPPPGRAVLWSRRRLALACGLLAALPRRHKDPFGHNMLVARALAEPTRQIAGVWILLQCAPLAARG